MSLKLMRWWAMVGQIQLVFLTLCLLIVPSMRLNGASNRDAALAQIDGLIANIVAVRESVHFQDEARLYVIEKETKELRKSIQELDPINGQIRQYYHRLNVRFLYSDDFFRFILTRRNEQSIRSMLLTVADIRNQLGAPDDQYTKVLKNNLMQMESSARDLIKLLTDTDAKRYKSLIEALTSVRKYLVTVAIPEADQGDRPSDIQANIVHQVYEQVKVLYPLLHELGEPSPSFEKISEIIGANEFIRDFGQIGRAQ